MTTQRDKAWPLAAVRIVAARWAVAVWVGHAPRLKEVIDCLIVTKDKADT